MFTVIFLINLFCGQNLCGGYFWLKSSNFRNFLVTSNIYLEYLGANTGKRSATTFNSVLQKGMQPQDIQQNLYIY